MTPKQQIDDIAARMRRRADNSWDEAALRSFADELAAVQIPDCAAPQVVDAYKLHPAHPGK